MRIRPELLTLYAVTDRSWLDGRQLADVVAEVLAGGATLVQLREKDMDTESFIEEARDIKKITDKYGVPLIINDNIEVCLASGAAGVHVGQSDMEAGHVRELLGADRIIGVTAKTVAQAMRATACGADYIGSGAVFGSTTKLDTKRMSLETLDDICNSVEIPVVAIGGIDETNIEQLAGHRMAGAAVVSGLFAQADPYAAAMRLRALAEKVRDTNGH